MEIAMGEYGKGISASKTQNIDSKIKSHKLQGHQSRIQGQRGNNKTISQDHSDLFADFYLYFY
jgi:hypothetical protein